MMDLHDTLAAMSGEVQEVQKCVCVHACTRALMRMCAGMCMCVDMCMCARVCARAHECVYERVHTCTCGPARAPCGCPKRHQIATVWEWMRSAMLMDNMGIATDARARCVAQADHICPPCMLKTCKALPHNCSEGTLQKVAVLGSNLTETPCVMKRQEIVPEKLGALVRKIVACSHAQK